MAKNNEAKIKFTAETKEFTAQIKSADSSLREMRSELKLNDAQMKNTGQSTELLKERHDILQRELDASKSKTDALSKKLETAERLYGENSEEVKKLQTQLNNAKSAEEAIQGEIDDCNKKLKEQKTAFDEVADKAEKAGEKLTNAGKKMSAVSAGIVAVGGASIAAFNAVDEGADNAIKATGATGKAAEELEASYKNVASNIVGDFGDLGSALGEVNTRFGFTGQKLEKTTTDFVKFSEVTGMDVTTAVQKVSRYMGDAGIDSSKYGEVLDQLTVAAQASGVSMDSLTENLTKYGAPMRTLGFETQESIAIFSSWEKAGVNTEIAFSGMKKAISTWSADGKDARVEFKKTLDEIKKCPDISSATTKAIEVFGAKAGPDLADAIQGGRFEYSEMLNLIEGSKGSLSGTFDATVDGGYQMELAMQNAKVALGEVGATLSESLAPVVEDVTAGLKGFADWWKNLNEGTQQTIIKVAGVVAIIGPLLLIFGQVAGAISKISTVMKMLSPVITIVKTAVMGMNTAFLACPITWIVVGIVALIAAFKLLWDNCEGFRNFWKNLWEGIKKVVGKVVEWIKTNWKTMLLFLVNPLAGVFKYLYDNFDGFRNFVDNFVKKVKGFFSNLWSGIKNIFSKVKDTITAPFIKARDTIKGVVDKIKGFFSGLKLKLPKIKLPHFSIKGKFSLSPPSVPKLSIDWYKNGGIMTKPTIFGMNGNSLMAGGEAGPEAILPIDKMRDYVAEAVQQNMQVANIQSLVQAVEDLANRPIKLSVNGREFALATASDSDSVSGLRTIFKNRGMAIE